MSKGAQLKRVFDTAQSCELMSLDHAEKQPATHTLIACYAALDTDTSTKLQAALAHHRRDPGIPVLFVTDDASLYASMRATTLGATKTLPRATPNEQLLVVLRRLAVVSRRVVAADTGKAEAEASIQQIGASLLTIFEAARRRQEIPVAVLEQSAESLRLSIRNSEIRDWLAIVRRYDDVTYQHCLLVAGLVVGFASRLGLAPQNQRLLAQAALVHDVGKSVIPREILTKTGPLSPAEMKVMQTHTTIGHDMLASNKGLAPGVLGIVRHHHEYIDGSGYPDRLKGSQISDLVRLVTICDIYAALIERRSYKPPMPPQQAFAVLDDMTGRLDPSLLKAFAGFVADM